MPTPTEYAGGFTGYSSQPMYEQALAELKANQPGAVAQYDALFGNAVPTQRNWGGGGGSRFGGSADVTPSSPSGDPFVPNYDTSTWSPALQASYAQQIANADANVGFTDTDQSSGTDYHKIVADLREQEKKVANTWARQETQLDPPINTDYSYPSYKFEERGGGGKVKPPPIDEVMFNYNQKKK